MAGDFEDSISSNDQLRILNNADGDVYPFRLAGVKQVRRLFPKVTYFRDLLWRDRRSSEDVISAKIGYVAHDSYKSAIFLFKKISSYYFKIIKLFK